MIQSVNKALGKREQRNNQQQCIYLTLVEIWERAVKIKKSFRFFDITVYFKHFNYAFFAKFFFLHLIFSCIHIVFVELYMCLPFAYFVFRKLDNLADIH